MVRIEEAEPLLERIKSKVIPLSSYWLKDYFRQVISNKNFHDALASVIALLSISIAFPFFPPEILIPLLAAVLILTMIHPLLGLMGLLLISLPMFIYQAPLLAWLAMLLVSVSLLVGYQHYRSITYGYALTVLPLSTLGYALEVPALILSILVLGFKRSAIIGTAAILLVVIVSSFANIQVSGPFAYNSSGGYALIQNQSFVAYLQPSKQAANFGNLIESWSSAFSTFLSGKVTAHITTILYYALLVLSHDFAYTLLQILLWVFVAFSISSYAIKSRSPYKGSFASLFGVILPISSFTVSYILGLPFSFLMLISFIATPLCLFLLEAMNIDVVLALDVMKQDLLGKFGVAFEDLTKGSSETLDDVADYDQTKRELREALLNPIEHKEIAGAYKITPAKGILLFGPPGTGKTLIMRALANEIRAGFYYVKGSSLISPFPGESAQTLSKVFATAKKHAPCILFFDEIDSVAGRREGQMSETGRELITTMLSEMDGFQKLSGVVIVGATNVPQLLDPGIMRPGRFDKIIYMPLPDQPGRAKIFKYYLSPLPIAKDIDYDKLASITSRFSPADIKNICEEVSRAVGEKALLRREMVSIKMADVLKTLKSTKPSTSLSQLEEYNTFQTDYERRAHPEVLVENEKKTNISDVVGLEEAKTALREAVEMPILHPELIKKYDISSIKGILLFGPPGTGKTMLMQAVANEIGGVRVLTISGYDLVKYGIDRATATVKETFDRAKENSPAIVFVDEIDALVPSRDTANEFGLQLTSEFLQEFDKIKQASGVVVVAATNRPDVLDPALLRAGRFDRLIFTPPPDKDSRAKIFEMNLEKAPLGPDVDFGKLAETSEGFTGADIANICRQAKINALEASLSAGNELKIGLKDIATLLQKARPSAPGIVMGRYLAFFGKYGKR